MDKAAADEKQKLNDASRKRSSSAAPTPDGPDAKRVKLEGASSAAASFLSGFDFTTLPATLVTELIVSNIQAFTEPELIELVQTYRNNRATAQTAASTVAPVPTAPGGGSTIPADASLGTPSRSRTPPPDALQNLAGRKSPPKAPAAMLAEVQSREVKEEPVDPLAMDIDDEAIEYEPDRLNYEVGCYALKPGKS